MGRKTDYMDGSGLPKCRSATLPLKGSSFQETKSKKPELNLARKKTKRHQLLQAAYFGKIDIISNLLEKGEDINEKASNGNTPLLIAVKQRQVEAVGFLLEKGADLNAQDTDRNDALSLAVCSKDVKMFKILWKHAVFMEPAVLKSVRGKLLHLAARLKAFELVEILLENEDVDIDWQDENESSPLMSAVLAGDFQVFNKLLDGSSIMLEDKRGSTALCLAISKKDRKMISAFYSRMTEYEKDWYIKRRIQLLIEPKDTCQDVICFYKTIVLPVFLEVKRNMRNGMMLLHKNNIFQALISCASHHTQHTDLLCVIFLLSTCLVYGKKGHDLVLHKLVDGYVEACGPALSLSVINRHYHKDLRTAAFLPLLTICVTERGKRWMKVNRDCMLSYVKEFSTEIPKTSYWIEDEEIPANLMFERFSLVLKDLANGSDDLTLKSTVNSHQQRAITRSTNHVANDREHVTIRWNLDEELSENSSLSSIPEMLQCTTIDEMPEPSSQSDWPNSGYAAAVKKNLNSKRNLIYRRIRRSQNASSKCWKKEKNSPQRKVSKKDLTDVLSSKHISSKPSLLRSSCSVEIQPKFPSIARYIISKQEKTEPHLSTTNKKSYTGNETAEIDADNSNNRSTETQSSDIELITKSFATEESNVKDSVSSNMHNISKATMLPIRHSESTPAVQRSNAQIKDVKKRGNDIELLYKMFKSECFWKKSKKYQYYKVFTPLHNKSLNNTLTAFRYNKVSKEKLQSKRCFKNKVAVTSSSTTPKSSKWNEKKEMVSISDSSALNKSYEFLNSNDHLKNFDDTIQEDLSEFSSRTSSPIKSHYPSNLYDCSLPNMKLSQAITDEYFSVASDHIWLQHPPLNSAYSTNRAYKYAEKTAENVQGIPKAPNRSTACVAERNNNVKPNFKLFHHRGLLHGLMTHPDFASIKNDKYFPRLLLQQSSRWFQSYFDMACLMTRELQKPLSCWKLVFFSSHPYFTLKGGSFGTYLGLHSSGLPLVAKCLDTSRSRDECDERIHNSQVTRAHRIRHDNLIRVYHRVVSSEFMCKFALTEVCEFNLSDYINGRRMSEPFDPRLFVFQLLSAMQYLHEQPTPILHGCLKPENVLITYSYQLKIADFYLWSVLPPVFGVRVDPDKVGQSSLTKFSWRPLELICAKSEKEAIESYTTASDVQVIGMLTYFMLSCGEHPYGIQDDECQENIKDDWLQIDPIHSDLEGRDLVMELLKHDEHKRLSMSQAFKHPYFWSAERKFQFLLATKDRIAFIAQRFGFVYELLILSCFESRHWIRRIDEKLYEFMTKDRKYEGNFVHLLHFAAHLKEVFHLLPLDLRKATRTPSTYFLRTFPTIFMSVYCIIRRYGVLQRYLRLDEFFYNS